MASAFIFAVFSNKDNSVMKLERAKGEEVAEVSQLDAILNPDILKFSNNENNFCMAFEGF